MIEAMFGTEQEVKEILLGVARKIDNKSAIFVAFREQAPNSLKRVVTFVIQTYEGNEKLVNGIILETTNHGKNMWFEKSDINIQSGNLTVDYLYIQALISPQLK